MARLVESYRDEARLSRVGRLIAIQDLRRLMTQRLLMAEERQAQPAIAGARVTSPVFITGLPRTGTTLLHGLMATHPRLRCPLTWEVMSPTPAPGLSSQAAVRKRIRRAEKQLRWLDRLAPGFQAIHEVGAQKPQECIAMMAHSGLSLRFVVTYRIPAYLALLGEADMRPAYAWHRRFLEHLQAGRAPRRWVLKAPAHLHDLEALLASYPDATIIQTHRDPVTTLPSLASLRVAIRRAFSRQVDPEETGREVLGWWSRALARSMEVRPRHPDRFIDVDYRQLKADPLGALEPVYSALGEPFDEAVRARCRAYLEAHPQGKHGRHDYRAEDFGFTESALVEAFAGYRRERGFDRDLPGRIRSSGP